MILTGILRHYLSTLLQTTPKKQPLAKIREQRSLLRAQNLRGNHQQISKSSFERRKEVFIEGVKEGKFLADPENRGKPRANPMSDPAMMEGMMGMMKGNVAMMVPQSLIMGWINAFFSGYVISMWYRRLERIWCTNRVCSETAFPTYTTVQADVASWCWNKGSGCQMGLQSELVLPYLVWTAASIQLHLGQQQWYVLYPNNVHYDMF